MPRRTSSNSTVRASAANEQDDNTATNMQRAPFFVRATLWVHEESFSTEEVLVSPSLLSTSSMVEGDLVEVTTCPESVEEHDFASTNHDSIDTGDESVSDLDLDKQVNTQIRCLCIVKFATSDLMEKYPGLEISLSKSIANAFAFRARTQVSITKTDFNKWTASHVELSFRDAYIARSDMWRIISNNVAGKTLFKGQKLAFFGSLKVTVKSIHVRGHHVSTGFFAKTTIPVFRSEAARFVLFIQMSREMWDFDSEGNGEIMFNKVINGFLPDLFRRWAAIEVRHMVSIILFGRLEYDRYDFGDGTTATGTYSQTSTVTDTTNSYHQDFYRVVVTDMASAQWTTILNELKKDFRVFLRDTTLHAPTLPVAHMASKTLPPKITGRPSTALKGNILEAINIASSQFANDYIDRDLIRTGISTVIITAGTGVFDVDRDLLNLTSENLTNNGIGIDIVCLSRMPLHSVPLFRYKLPQTSRLSRVSSSMSDSPHAPSSGVAHPSLPSLGHSPAYSSFTSASVNYFSRFPSAFPSRLPQHYGYGIPQWIDLSYWSSESDNRNLSHRKSQFFGTGTHSKKMGHPFTPRVRMYELQMMGIMELGMADMSIPYLSETSGKQHGRRRRVYSDLPPLPSTKNLSQSPTYTRKLRATAAGHKDDHGLLGSQAKTIDGKFDDMDKYDEHIFQRLDVPESKHVKPKNKKVKSDKVGGLEEHVENSERSQAKATARSVQTHRPVGSSSASVKKITSEIEVGPKKSPQKERIPRISRTISYALRGLAPPLRTAASPEVNVENIKAQPSTAKTSTTQALASSPTHHGRSSDSIRSSETDRDSHRGIESDARSVLSSDTLVERPSKPISIGVPGFKTADHKKPGKSHVLSHVTKYGVGREEEDSINDSLATSLATSDDDPISSIRSLDLMPDSVPRSNLPFIRNVNASNPLKRHPGAASAFGRWQHLYPRKPRSSTVKWRSLCTPASVPLTTEDFPSAKELASEYDTHDHSVSIKYLNETLEEPVGIQVLLQEMIALRLAHGYQVVTGEGISRAIGKGVIDREAFLDARRLSERGHLIYMIMGNTIQRLSFTASEQIDVTKYVRRAPQLDPPFAKSYHYIPNIRTILSEDFKPRSLELAGFSEEYPWESADSYLAANGIGQDHKVHELRFWRARFVLIPVEPPANVYRPPQHADDNEEETHLLGIRALTQMWQKVRYFSVGDRKLTHGRMGSTRRRDQNPLEIRYETLNPSEFVATELDKLLTLEERGDVQSVQLLPESEKLDREVPMSKLAQAMQGDKGIEFSNRRWHLRLHYNCFQGEEFTTWLVHNMKNMETRAEAVEFGNGLMREGMFEHVSNRHIFRDGNYFYSLKTEYRSQRPELRGSWFGTSRRDKSIPPTPSSEHATRDLAPLTTRSRSGSSLAFHLNPSTPSELSRPFVDKRKKKVCLSKMIKIDVDPRKRSPRREIVNLHYDRLHNPENCYHIELDWLNVTSKLVDDAIISWTSQAEKYGLKLVEVPIAEACEVPRSEPFRAVYRIKLAVEPPKRIAFNHVFTTSSFAPQPTTTPDPHVYQKAILKRFNFVLDLEASSDFPENVNIEYSWGKSLYRYTQFIHRSGIGLAQITTDGDIILLANRLYNSRFASSKEAAMKFDPKKELRTNNVNNYGPLSVFRPSLPYQSQSQNPLPTQQQQHHQLHTSQTTSVTASVPSMTASGLIARNAQSPALSPFSPRTSADVFGSKPALSTSALAAYVTPEQIKDDIESFCHDPIKLEHFYREVNLALSMQLDGHAHQSRRKTTAGGGGSSSTSSSLLRPIREPTDGVTDLEVPAFELPPSVAGPLRFNSSTSIASGATYGTTGSIRIDTTAGAGSGSGNGNGIGSGSGPASASISIASPAMGIGSGSGAGSGSGSASASASASVFGMFKRARNSVIYDSAAEMLSGLKDKDKDKDRERDRDRDRDREGSVDGGYSVGAGNGGNGGHGGGGGRNNNGGGSIGSVGSSRRGRERKERDIEGMKD